MRQRSTRANGFTLVELMVVILIIGVLIAVAIPVFQAAEQRAARRVCLANQREVEGAYQVYVSSVQALGAAADWSDVMSALVPNYIDREPTCPDAGIYSWSEPLSSCSVASHVP